MAGPHFEVMDGAAERIRAWQSSSIPAVRDAAYAAVLRRQFNADGTARRADEAPVVDVVDDRPL